ncbi:MAG: hypothetical protein IJ695_00205 [Butyrivibrio sp.]|nr:hypothetical protein [Butyrivibrio sp.]
MSPRKQAEHNLKNAGYCLDRHGAKHDIYKDGKGHRIPLKRHDFDDNDLAYINKEIAQNGGA